MKRFRSFWGDGAAAFITAMVFLTQSGCFSIPLSANLGPPENSAGRVDATAWVGKVEVTDTRARQAASLSDSLALSIRDYVDAGEYFRGVKMLPGRPATGDYVLDFTFEEFYQRRRFHAAYFPAAILTLTLYIWFGGPIVVDTIDLAGTLQITGADGRLVATSTSSVQEKDNRSLYSDQYLTADITAERTRLIRELLENAVGELKRRGR